MSGREAACLNKTAPWGRGGVVAVEVVTLEQVGLGAALAFAVHELGVCAAVSVAFEDAFASLAPFVGRA
jgi:hypothetical protein